tara:strand:+ start:1704 stop:2477 length:774 start_codon:yes stop_codon:yes gene_type:complete
MAFDLLHDLNTDCNFTDKIKESSFVEAIPNVASSTITTNKNTNNNTNNNNNNKVYHNIISCIISEFDPILMSLNLSEHKLYLSQKLMDICSKIDESDVYYHDYHFNEKIMKAHLIQQGLQSFAKRDNHISSIYYLNEFYKRHFVIIHQNIAYETTLKNYPKVYLGVGGNNVRIIDEYDEKEKGNLSYLHDKIRLLLDIKKDMKFVHNLFLDPISKYKMDDLKKIAGECNISLKADTKNKVKGVLYDEINLYKLNDLS